ncbi:MAG: hypothetical protein BXU00_00865 [Candidatus Nanoclepta minutus]|uniref:S-layer protein outer domain-containing protein n=1 Tax=Candidatus Nanoclepta minutus TaxID=1940235 RepID=A0A397WNK1_9ARCH|nr:MAG: hypothetical protein BXU00_00865 [Candidatus Nanoclepta minutus]
MAGSFKKEGTNKYIMMNRKTLAGVGSLVVLGASVLAQGTTTLGGVREAVKQNPSAWYVVVGKDAKASDVIGAADVIAALQYYTVQRSVQPVDLSAVKVVLQHPVLNETDLLTETGYNNVVENRTVVVNNTPIYYSVNLEVPSLEVSLNESNTLQVEKAGFTVTLSFSDKIDNLNNTKITVLGKDFYVVVSDKSYSEIDLRRVPIQEYNLYLNQQITFLGHTISLVDIYETIGQGYTAVLSVDGQEVEIPIGQSKTVNGLEIYVAEGKKSWVNSSNTYVKIGIGGGEVYKLIQKAQGSSDYDIKDPSRNIIGTATLLDDGKTLELTFTKDYLFAGDSYELPIFGGYKIVFKPYALPPANADLVTVTYAGQQTIGETVYNVFNIQFTDPVTGNQVTLPIYYTGNNPWAIGAPDATKLTVLSYKGGNSPVSIDSIDGISKSISTINKAYVLLTDDSSVSRLLKIEVDSLDNVGFAQITDLLNGQQYQLDPTYNPSVEIPLGNNKVVKVEVKKDSNNKYQLCISNIDSPGTLVDFSKGDALVDFYTSSGDTITIGPLTDSKLSVGVGSKTSPYTFALDGTNQALDLSSSSLLSAKIVKQGSTLYRAVYDNNNNYIIYPLGVKCTRVDFYLAIKDKTPSPEVKLQDLIHSTTEEYKVAPGGSVKVGEETLTVASLEGVPAQIETAQVGTPLIGGAILDTEVTANMNNLIVIGGPAVNKLAADLLQVAYPTYGDTLKEMGILAEGEGLIKVFTTPKVAVLVMGWEAEDTRAAARVLSAFLAEQGYPELASKEEAKVRGGLQNTQVS